MTVLNTMIREAAGFIEIVGECSWGWAAICSVVIDDRERAMLQIRGHTVSSIDALLAPKNYR